MDSDQYQLTIKSANQKVDDYVTNCCPNWNVKRLKQHISETHINKPGVEDQRLIYAGNLLKDHQILKQIFFRDSLCTELTNSSKTDFTIHLVCSQHKLSNSKTKSDNSSSPSVPSATSRPSSSTASTNNNVTLSSTATPSTSNERGIASRLNQAISAPRNSTTTSPRSIHSATAQLNSSHQPEMIQNLMQSDHMRHQMAIFQQLARLVASQIARNINNNIIQDNLSNSNTFSDRNSQASELSDAINGQAINTSTILPFSNATAALLYQNRQQTQLVQTDPHDHHQNENINNENNPNPQVVVEPNGAQFGFAQQMQAPAPVVDQPAARQEQDIPMLQHDVIDWVYYSIRAVVLMAALYIHASMFRLLFIVVLLGTAYFFNRRAFRRAMQSNQPAPVQEMNLAGQQQLQQQQANNQENVEDVELRRRNLNQGDQPLAGENNFNNINNENADGGAAVRIQEEQAPERLPILKLCYLVLTEFLASLVPELVYD